MKPLVRGIFLLMAVLPLLLFSSAVQAAPALQLPWPSGHQHRIAGGNGYNCDTHTTDPATGGPPLYNADKFALDFQFGSIDGSPLDVGAAADGTIVYRANNQDGYGNKVVIDHGGSLVSVYAHLKDNSWAPGITQGAAVNAGQLLALAGNTGGPYLVHLHFHMMLGLNAYVPEPMSGVSGFGAYGDCTGVVSQYWVSRPVWQPNGAYQNWGTLWGGVTESATASALDMSQTKFVALARANASAGGTPQWRQWNYNGGGTWNNWTTISGLTGINGKIALSNHRNGTQEQLHVAAIKNGDMYYASRVGTGNWSNWTSLSHPPGVTFDGAVAISNSDVRVVVAGMSGGNVWVRLRYSGSWGVWVGLGGGNTLTGSLAISTRPNGQYHIAALRFDGHIFTTCSTDYAQWNPGWADIGWIFGDALAIDNDAASGACGIGGDPGVVVLGFSGNVAYVWCWEAYCPQPYEQIGGAVGGPAAISNAVNPFSGNIRWIQAAVRSGNSELSRYRVY